MIVALWPPAITFSTSRSSLSNSSAVASLIGDLQREFLSGGDLQLGRLEVVILDGQGKVLGESLGDRSRQGEQGGKQQAHLASVFNC